MAAGDTLIFFYPGGSSPPTANPALPDRRNGHNILRFGDTVNVDAIFEGGLVRAYGGGGITAYYHVTMSVAITGDVDIDGAFERVGAVQDVDVDSFAAPQSIDNTTVPGTAGIPAIISKAFTNGAQIDSIAVGEKFRFKVTRDAVNDTASGDMELHMVELRETP